MAKDTLLSTSGTLAWDVPSNWSLGTVPQAGDDVSITGSSSSALTLTIAASDPAYTIASLTETTANPNAGGEWLSVVGRLTVTGSTNITTGTLSASNTVIAFNTVTLSNSAEILETGNAAASLTINSLVAGSGIIGGSVFVGGGSATIGSVSGPVSVDITGATATIGNSAGTSFFDLNNGHLNLQSPATTFADAILTNNTNTVDLLNIPYQQGESYSVSLVSSGIFNYYSITLKSSGGQTLYTFQNVEGVGALNAQTAPLVSVAGDGANGTLVTLACYAAETRIAVPGGEKLVRDLAIGDMVVTAAGTARPIKWIGRRSYAGRFLQANPAAMPIRFTTGSLGHGLPRRDLLVSQQHAMFIDGLLIPARCLVNGNTVIKETRMERVDYFHLELDRHDVILAEGAPSETFVDDDSRAIFHNAAEFDRMYPDAAEPTGYCAPRVQDGYQVEAIRQRLATIAAEMKTAA